MEDLFEKLTHNSLQVRTIQNSIDNVKVMPYYDIYGGPLERNKDLDKAISKLKIVLDKRHTLLENLQLTATKELAWLSSLQRENNIEKIKGCQD